MLRHVYPMLCHRPDQCRMGAHSAPLACSAPYRSSTSPSVAHAVQRDLLPAPHGRSLALSAGRTADIMDRDGVKLLLPASIATTFPRLRHVWLDTGYNGQDKGKDWIEKAFGWSAQIVAHPRRPSKGWIFEDLPDDQIDWSKYLPPPGFRVLPRRWVVERTFSWHLQNRRLRKDYERLCATSEALIYLAMIRLVLRRLARF